MQQAGLPSIQSFNMSMISLALGMVGTLGSWFLMSLLGRRTIHFTGTCILFVILVTVGSMSFAGTESSLWGISALLIVFVFVYDSTIGPVTYSIISEISSTRLKSKTVVLARAAYNASNIVVNILTVSSGQSHEHTNTDVRPRTINSVKQLGTGAQRRRIFGQGPVVAYLFGCSLGKGFIEDNFTGH
jgi:hypothetical protein